MGKGELEKGVGDKPLRSSNIERIWKLKEKQPTSRKNTGRDTLEHPFPYLQNRRKNTGSHYHPGNLSSSCETVQVKEKDCNLEMATYLENILEFMNL